MVRNEDLQNMGIVSLLLNFGWTWVGLFIVNDDSGEHFMKTLEPLLSENGICLSSTGRIPNQFEWDHSDVIDAIVSKTCEHFTDNKANVFILYGESMTLLTLNGLIIFGAVGCWETVSLTKVWILTAQIDFTLSGLQRGLNFDFFQGALSFTIQSHEVPGFQKYLQTIKPNWIEGDGFLKDFWGQAFDCSFPDSQEKMKDNGTGTCTGDETLVSLPGFFFEMHMTGHSYSIYNAVHAVAHVLHAISKTRSIHRATWGGKTMILQHLQPWQVRPLLM